MLCLRGKNCRKGKKKGAQREHRIRLFPLGGAPRDLVVNGWYGFDSGSGWSPDGKGFYVSSLSPTGVTLLHIDLSGEAAALWEQKGGPHAWGLPSLDGRRRQFRVTQWTATYGCWRIFEAMLTDSSMPIAPSARLFRLISTESGWKTPPAIASRTLCLIS